MYLIIIINLYFGGDITVGPTERVHSKRQTEVSANQI